jgi:hypothetical protein
VAFLVGWTAGIALVLAVAAALGRVVGIDEAGGLSVDETGGLSVWSALALTIGALAFAIANREQRQHRRRAGRSPTAWVAGVGAL